MPKLRIGTLAIGNYIRSPKDHDTIMQIFEDAGNDFRCHPVLSSASGKIVLDMKNYKFIPKDRIVQQVTI